MTSYPRAMTSSVSAVTSSSVNLSHEQQPEVSTESEQAELPVLHTEPVDTSSNLSMKVYSYLTNDLFLLIKVFLQKFIKARTRIDLSWPIYIPLTPAAAAKEIH